MTPAERAAEVQRILHASGEDLLAEGLTTFGDVHQRIGELVGRDVFNHELVEPDRLAREILTGERPSIDDILAVLRRHMRPGAQIIVADPNDPDDLKRALDAAAKHDEGGAR